MNKEVVIYHIVGAQFKHLRIGNENILQLTKQYIVPKKVWFKEHMENMWNKVLRCKEYQIQLFSQRISDTAIFPFLRKLLQIWK